MIPRVPVSALIVPFLAACASYTPSSAPVPEPIATEWSIEDTVAVAVDPYSDAKRQMATFDANLNSADVIAMQVVAQNRGPQPMLIRPSDMVLELPGGRKLSPSGITTVVNKVGERGSVVGASIAFGLIGAIVASNAEESARNARTADYKEKAFKDTTMAANDEAHGFVFFIPPRGTAAFDQATLQVRFIDLDAATSKVVRASVTGLHYEETKQEGNNDVR